MTQGIKSIIWQAILELLIEKIWVRNKSQKTKMTVISPPKWPMYDQNDLSSESTVTKIYLVCWLVDDSDVGDVYEFRMDTDLTFWWQNHYVGDLFRCVSDFLPCMKSATNLSPISHQTGYSHVGDIVILAKI